MIYFFFVTMVYMDFVTSLVAECEAGCGRDPTERSKQSVRSDLPLGRLGRRLDQSSLPLLDRVDTTPAGWNGGQEFFSSLFGDSHGLDGSAWFCETV